MHRSSLTCDPLFTGILSHPQPAAQRNLMVVLLQEYVDLRTAKVMLKGLAYALKHLHDHGKIHGDLKVRRGPNSKLNPLPNPNPTPTPYTASPLTLPLLSS